MNTDGYCKGAGGEPVGRTHAQTIKQRRIDVYLPNLETKAQWKDEASRRGRSLSEMVFEVVQHALQGEQEDARKRADELQVTVGDLTDELARLRHEVGDLEAVKDRMERDLEQYRAQEFMHSTSTRQLDSRLIRVLADARTRDRKPRPVSGAELRKVLRIQKGDVTRLHALAEQLEYLELHEVVTKKAKGWVWNG